MSLLPTDDDFEVPTCSICGRKRTLGLTDHPMDAYDYSPMQMMSGKPLGWYSGSDGQMCPEDMEKMRSSQGG